LNLVGNFFPYREKEKFKLWLSEIIIKSTRLSEKRIFERQEEIKRDRLDFFYHSDQALILSLLKDPFRFWEETLTSWNKQDPIEIVTISILSYYDPCVRCGDFLLRVSEELLFKSLSSYLEKSQLGEELIKDTVFFIRYAWIKPYSDPMLDGSYLSPLRLRDSSQTLSALQGQFVPVMC
jgi:hypothetical protein